MSTRFEGSFHGHDQSELFFQLWPVDRPRGTIVVTHGLAEHSDCYHPLARDLQSDGWQVYGWDLRGHGRSEGKRGYVSDFGDYVKDLKIFVEFVVHRRQETKTPFFYFGHSLGGLITSLLALDWPTGPAQALLLSSPLFGIAVPVPMVKDQVARLAHRWLPSITLYNEIKYTNLTRDEEMVASYAKDTLRHDKISPAVYLGMMAGCERMAKEAGKIEIPIFMQLAGIDRIVSTHAAQEVFSRLTHPRSKLELYPESLHEIYNDLDRSQALGDLRQFINQFQVAT